MTVDTGMTGTGQKLTRDELVAELKAEHGIDVAELQARAAIYPRYRQAVQIMAEAAVRAGRLIRGEEAEHGDGD